LLSKPKQAAVAIVGLKTAAPFREELMKSINLSTVAVKAALLSGLFMALAPGIVLGAEIAKKGSTSYNTHFVFHPMSSIDIPGVSRPPR